LTRTILHLAQDSDTSGYFPQLARWHDRSRFRMIFGTLGAMDPRVRRLMEQEQVACLDCGCRARWAYPLGLVRLVRQLRRERVDILHTHLFDPSVVGLVAGTLARTPLRVMTRHYSDYHTRINRPVHVWLDLLATRLSHEVIAVSHHTADHMIRVEHAPRGKIHVVANGIDFDRVRISSPEAPIRLRRELGLERARIVLMAARLHPEKGYEFLLQATRLLKPRVEGLVLLIAGTGALESHYRSLASSLGVEDVVRFLGFRRDLPDLMAFADVVVLPSVAEAFGLVLAEAIYLGRPVVATRVGGIPEIVEDGVDGVLVPPSDAASLADALERVLSDASLAKRVATHGPPKIAARFSFERMMRDYERIYEDSRASR
jgi:glycosyltransferase involved in cell wall biosynthesis